MAKAKPAERHLIKVMVIKPHKECVGISKECKKCTRSRRLFFVCIKSNDCANGIDRKPKGKSATKCKNQQNLHLNEFRVAVNQVCVPVKYVRQAAKSDAMRPVCVGGPQCINHESGSSIYRRKRFRILHIATRQERNGKTV